MTRRYFVDAGLEHRSVFLLLLGPSVTGEVLVRGVYARPLGACIRVFSALPGLSALPNGPEKAAMARVWLRQCTLFCAIRYQK